MDAEHRDRFTDELAEMPDAKLMARTELGIWLSAFAANNPRAPAHWQVDLCYAECEKREAGMYDRCHKKVMAGV